MHMHRTGISKTMVVSVAAIAVAIALHALASRPTVIVVDQVAPARIGFVDMNRLSEQLSMFKDAEQEIVTARDELLARENVLRSEVTRLEEEIELLEPGTPAFNDMLRNLSRKTMELRAFVEFAQLSIGGRRGNVLSKLYQNIANEAEAYADANGLDAVMINDTDFEFEPGPEDHIQQQIALRRTLFRHRRLDVTDDLAAFINAR
jgi:Skp family chaperone for outer membrane proteins